ncbi:hypothetical protein KP509_26G040400 [Ceratopteris richardii]|nr:hypothetical protein KP509_26G040400 [Ceratopteris richardii]
MFATISEAKMATGEAIFSSRLQSWLQVASCPASVPNQLSSCVSILGGVLGDPLMTQCCSLLLQQGEIEVQFTCLCDAVNSGALGVISAPVKPHVINNIFITCGLKVPTEFDCP